jgi:deoxycitidine kinase
MYSFIDEPVGVWSALKNERSESLLEVYYKDRKRWSYTFQSCAILSRYQNIEKSISSAIGKSKQPNLFLTERCLDTDYHVFTKMLVADGSIDKLEFDIYKRLFDHLKSTAVPLTAIIYVNTPPAVCMDRIQSRGREGEEGIPLEYLQNLANFQDSWLSAAGVPVLRTDGTSVDDVTKFLDDLLKS